MVKITINNFCFDFFSVLKIQFKRMVEIDDVEEGLKAIHILFCSFIFVIFYFCWKSTNVTEVNGVHHLPLGNFGIRKESKLIALQNSLPYP